MFRTRVLLVGDANGGTTHPFSAEPHPQMREAMRLPRHIQSFAAAFYGGCE